MLAVAEMRPFVVVAYPVAATMYKRCPPANDRSSVEHVETVERVAAGIVEFVAVAAAVVQHVPCDRHALFPNDNHDPVACPAPFAGFECEPYAVDVVSLFAVVVAAAEPTDFAVDPN